MATIAFNDSSDPPPSYDVSVSKDSIRSKQSVFSFIQSKHKASVLSLIHQIVSSPGFGVASVAPIIKSCAAALPAAKFSKLLQKRNIENHTALYWAIVNNRREALLEFVKFIPKFSRACSADLRLACMAANDHDSFMLLHLGDNDVDSKDRSLRRMLGCPLDDIQVREGDTLNVGSNIFFVHFVFRMFQKRLRTARKLEVEFVAQGRIWMLRFGMNMLTGDWFVELGISRDSSAVRPNAVLDIQANKLSPGSDIMQPLHLYMRTSHILLPGGVCKHYMTGPDTTPAVSWQLSDWPMHANTAYVDCNGTLTAELTMTIKPRYPRRG
ncbi:uncharacterized protein F5891DRAFT_278210 [Suillus fuscotomentosus]|uniref:Uncharacterized protein n=1 Tax=Suillus fuscotomentosus TaxID=1912939 RepID=A0AAD4E796_9AGAM|nr:uncharacterized protein F5891DRAFT_278210 [Suillus fuscotomentosus]KAG1901043.1 hypothetical protein F5891DRAFT_278210 [Suillus fuscotomentosus]